MEREIGFYRTLIRKMRGFLTNRYSEPDITIITCLLDVYHSSMECVYSEYNKASFISKWLWKKRLREQFRNIQQFYIKFIVFYDRLLDDNRKLFNECERLEKENEKLKEKTKNLPRIATLNKRIHELKEQQRNGNKQSI